MSEPPAQIRVLHITKEDNSRLVGFIQRTVEERLIEQQFFPVVPGVSLAIERERAFLGIGSDKANVIAKRGCQRIMVASNSAPGWQRHEHGGENRRDSLQDRTGMRARAGG